jgi:hypothetical protein
MPDKSGKIFDRRAFVATLMAISAMGLPVTGILLHVNDTAEMTPSKHAWMAAHNALAVVFVIFGIWHIILNRKVLVRHLFAIAKTEFRFRREMIYAVILMAILMLISVGHTFLG